MKQTVDLEALENQAVEAAMKNRWDDAIAANSKILGHHKRNLPAILRLGFSYLQAGKFLKARELYQRALKVQPGNTLALENLEKIKILRSRSAKKGVKKMITFNPSLFLEITGSTKSVALVNLGQKNILAQVSIGEELELRPRRIKIEVRTLANDYVGGLPDDLSKRLLLFIKAGSAYKTFIKEVSMSRVVVFIRQEKKGKKVQQFTSFPKDMGKNIGRLEHIEEGGEDTDDEDGNEHVLDIERMAEGLAEDKDMHHYAPTHSDEDEENIEE